MKRFFIYVAVISAAVMVSCNGKKTAQNDANNDSTRALSLLPTARE